MVELGDELSILEFVRLLGCELHLSLYCSATSVEASFSLMLIVRESCLTFSQAEVLNKQWLMMLPGIPPGTTGRNCLQSPDRTTVTDPKGSRMNFALRLG